MLYPSRLGGNRQQEALRTCPWAASCFTCWESSGRVAVLVLAHMELLCIPV